MEEIRENNNNETMSQKKNVPALMIVAVIAVAGVALYYFFLYQPKESQYQTFSFVSGDVVGKDDALRTITIASAEDQLIPPGIRKTFYIADEAIIQRIIQPETENQSRAAMFKKADFDNIQIGDGVVIQGEFTTDTTVQEKMATAVSILPEKPAIIYGEQVVGDVPDIFKATFSGVVTEKDGDYIIVSANDAITRTGQNYAPEGKYLPKGALRKVLITGKTKITKIASSEKAAPEDISVGAQVVVGSKDFVNIIENTSFEAASIAIVEIN
ncbi:MAG: hypothetical protein A2931_01315 [Candidatus Niyogibacteria bacterium RIFCSPLOWO2_01_FULL_45_48]|uniref:DUF5666 domain-containing protein n=2 Tax=Candidatus Niyogiibacteriota TaxID=1817912 RepID=A0A1G2EY52_9BACT|nr:MAG: hypothetical protein A2835_01545 [Candidatus Niyogibacteria bacterium RIFCSPHIGHO2_01_FULL_45_28]OGZ29691.1 MAG: hypothetical protein A2931_01315 [Candidatus Niyogibacteria bacterium RIFCSPLOWO2_01_FULL_45_48]OGZ30442.1 MAG: hypothetical protein A3J00_04195 [Candidatus Niyogibacteria bacterium RIFCSPLOWO2_02_FULL_45_13]